jgi:hypothetical protein
MGGVCVCVAFKETRAGESLCPAWVPMLRHMIDSRDVGGSEGELQRGGLLFALAARFLRRGALLSSFANRVSAPTASRPICPSSRFRL